jgi:fucose permease
MEDKDTKRRSLSGHDFLLLFIAFLGIFVYGLLTALPGTVLPELERNRFLPNDAVAATFLLINAIGAVVAYIVSGPITDRIGKKFTLSTGAALVIAAMAGFALTVTYVQAAAALLLIMTCSLVLGLGANAIVSAGHALVGDIAEAQRNAALNLLDVCFGLGLLVLPLVAQGLPAGSGLGVIFWIVGGGALVLLVMVAGPQFPKPAHPESFPLREAGGLFLSLSFWLLAIALFMYVGAEVSVGKWVVNYLERDPRLLQSAGINPTELQHMSSEALTNFFKLDPSGKALASFALSTLSLFGFALMIGRLISSFLLGVVRVNTFLLLTAGSTVTAIGLAIALTTDAPATVRWAVVASGIGMGPIFPTSVGLASVIVPRIAGTAMSWVMGIGFAGLLVIPPAVGYISNAAGENGDVRRGLFAVLTAAILMLALHIILSFRQGREKTG